MDYPSIFIIFICFVSINANQNRHYIPTFFHLVNEPYFIDKTELIRFLFEASTNLSYTPIHYISCPHGFGKRTNLLMIKAFAELEVDYETRYIKPWIRTTAASFFKHLKISKYTNLIIEHLAQHPVIHLNFRIPQTGVIRSVERVLNDVLMETISDLRWLASHLGYHMEEPGEREWYMKKDAFEQKFCKVFNVDRNSVMKFTSMFQEDLPIRDLEMSLYYLGNVLYSYYGNTKVILLVENFQSMALHTFATCRPIGLKLYWSLNAMLERALSGTNFFQFAVITSTGGVASSILKSNAFLDNHPFTNYFGFSERDVVSLCSRYRLSKKQQNEILKYGYLTSTKKTTIFQPSTTIDLVMDIYQYGKILQNSHYQWIDPSWHTLLESFFHMSYDFASKIDELLREGKFSHRISKQLVRGAYPEFLKACAVGFKRNPNETARVRKDVTQAIFNLCFGLGYLCHAPGKNYNTFIVPNPGVKELLQTTLQKWARLFSTISASGV